jgi:hypothetical protein
MNATSRYEVMQSDIQRRLDAVEVRLAAAIRQGQKILLESIECDQTEGDPLRRIDAIEVKLEAIEKQLQKIESEMRDKESPPTSFAPTLAFS